MLKAGDHGVPGGENMLAYPDGEVRYFTVRECARLQTFPDNYVFMGSWTESMRQLGNAVPVQLAKMVAKGVHDKLRNFAKIAKQAVDEHAGDGECVKGGVHVVEDGLTHASAPTRGMRRRRGHV